MTLFPHFGTCWVCAALAVAAKKLAETPSQPAVENDIISDVDNTLFPLVVLLMAMLANTASNGAVEGVFQLARKEAGCH